MSTCSKCNAKIEWIKTEKGRQMPVDLEPVTVVTKEGKTVRGYIPHWATCPNADDFRKKGGDK